MKTSELSGELLARYIALIGLNSGIYTRDREIYTKPYIHIMEKGTVCFAPPNTRIDNRTLPIPPKFYRPTIALFEPEKNANQGIEIIERLRIKVEPDGHWALATAPNRISMRGETYLKAGLRAVVASVYGDEVPDEVQL